MALEVLQRSGQRELGRRLIVAASMITVEAMVGCVNEHVHVRLALSGVLGARVHHKHTGVAHRHGRKDVRLEVAVARRVQVPIVASGGCGNDDHIHEVLTRGEASAALAASIFSAGTSTW